MLNFIHFTDCHLGNGKDVIYKNTNPYSLLEKICQQIKTLHLPVDFILVTGDISQTGESPSYELFYALTKALNTPIYCLPGNHDNPVKLNAFFPNSPVDHISYLQINGVLLFLINTSVENEEYGDISTPVLNELEYFLKQNPRMPAIVAMHHPTIKTDTPWMDKITIKDKDYVSNYLMSRKNVKLVLSGHAHMDLELAQDDTVFISTPSTCYQFKQRSKSVEYDSPNPAYRMIRINDHFQISHDLIRVKT